MDANKKTEILCSTEKAGFQMPQPGSRKPDGSANVQGGEKKPLWKRCFEWFLEVDVDTKVNFLFSLFLYPAFVIIAVYGFFTIEMNIPLTYVVMIPPIIVWWYTSDMKRRERNAPMPEGYIEYLRKKLDEMDDVD